MDCQQIHTALAGLFQRLFQRYFSTDRFVMNAIRKGYSGRVLTCIL